MRRSPKPGSNLPLVFMVVIVVVMAVVVGFILGNWMLSYLLGPQEMETVSYGPLLDETTMEVPAADDYLHPDEIREITFDGSYLVQLGAFKEQANARTLMEELRGKGYSAFMTDGSPYRVQVGMFRSREEAEAIGSKLKEDGYEFFISR